MRADCPGRHGRDRRGLGWSTHLQDSRVHVGGAGVRQFLFFTGAPERPGNTVMARRNYWAALLDGDLA